MTERYIAAYILECLTGFQGTNPDYKSVIRHTRVVPNSDPIMKGVVEIVQTSGEDPRNFRIKEKVRLFVMKALHDMEIEKAKKAEENK